MPRRWVTTRLMSTAALASRSMAETRCSTLDICSASRGDRAASTQISRISCTRSLQALFELVDLGRHRLVVEEECGVRQVDHELRGVFRLREHGLEISWRSVVAHQLCVGGSARRVQG